MVPTLQLIETEVTQSTAPFLQGDIIRLLPESERPDPALGVIINADCDLVNCKIDGFVSYFPVYSFSRYFEKFWIPTYIEARRLELLNQVTQICALQTDNYDALTNWLRDDAANIVIENLSKTYSVRPNTIAPKIAELSLIERSNTFDARLLERIFEEQHLEKKDAFAKLARRALKNLGDGNFFINEIAGLDQIGFVIRMRRIYGIDAEHVHPSPPSITSPGKHTSLHAVRIAKLSNLYRFKMAQLFSYQFSRIGLPDEITRLNEIAAEAAALEIGTNS
ncbi:hypothetical protein S58_50060 [Bradyrhizobium oligotrophicum S58]|uniref:Uncharacterized protein n=1 Tax=Bradyrhizobium oligotrophicum S58 TaxID=1245469 RepID=M4ZX74_9BRAD|nr:hypothetical protein [Bradyrhizobium oligotrophicum]BAM90985.1 hypothetical protein S58_50060 [Bradyrhizobium oligotrophicum S58]